MFSVVYGLKAEKNESIKEQIDYLKKHKISTQYVYKITSNYIDSLTTQKYCIDTFSSVIGFSPIQFRCYDNKGKFITGWEQCFGSIKHAIDFNKYPLTLKRSELLNYNLHLDNELQMLNIEEKDKVKLQSDINNAEYIIFAYWEISLGKFSKDLLTSIENYINKNNYSKVLFIKVNTSQ